MDPLRRLRQIALVLVAVGATLVGGTIGFRQTLDESWFQSFYRGVITVTLTGLDSVPSNNGSRIVSIVLVCAGLTIIGYAGAVIVETISGGVVSGALAERRRERTIERLRDHFIICGYGRVGRRVADEFRASDVPFLVLDPGEGQRELVLRETDVREVRIRAADQLRRHLDVEPPLVRIRLR